MKQTVLVQTVLICQISQQWNSLEEFSKPLPSQKEKKKKVNVTIRPTTEVSAAYMKKGGMDKHMTQVSQQVYPAM